MSSLSALYMHLVRGYPSHSGLVLAAAAQSTKSGSRVARGVFFVCICTNVSFAYYLLLVLLCSNRLFLVAVVVVAL